MQQHLMQMQPMMAAYGQSNQVTTDIIQQYLDENKQLILAILENQNSGKADECAENQAKLQRNLMYLAAIADNQPQVPTIAQFPPNVSMMQSGGRYMQQQGGHPMTPQSLMAARSAMLYAQSPMSSLHQQAAMHGQHGGNNSGGFSILHGESTIGGNGSLPSAPGGGVFPDFGRSSVAPGKQQESSSGDATEPLYLKGSEEEAN